MKLKIGALADTHIGYQGNASLHNKFGELRTERSIDGLNARTYDTNKAFEQAIDIFIEEKVDIVVHAGDGMNFWGYKYPSYFNFYMKQINKLSKAGIQYIEIAGNHNFAKKFEVGCDLEKLELLPNVHTVYDGKYRPITIKDTNIVVHCLPSSVNKEVFVSEFTKIRPSTGKFNLFLSHCGVSTIDYYAKSENAMVLHLDDLRSQGMDLTVLGDFHKFVDFGDNIYYPGATERFSISEVNEEPRVLIFDVIDGSKSDEPKVEKMKSILLDVRPMLDLPPINAENKKLIEIQDEIVETLTNHPIEDAIVRLRVQNISKELKHQHLFLTEEIISLQQKSLIFKLDFQGTVSLEDVIRSNENIKFDNIFDSFDGFVKDLPENPDIQTEDVIRLGKKYLEEAIENEDS